MQCICVHVGFKSTLLEDGGDFTGENSQMHATACSNTHAYLTKLGVRGEFARFVCASEETIYLSNRQTMCCC